MKLVLAHASKESRQATAHPSVALNFDSIRWVRGAEGGGGKVSLGGRYSYALVACGTGRVCDSNGAFHSPRT